MIRLIRLVILLLVLGGVVYGGYYGYKLVSDEEIKSVDSLQEKVLGAVDPVINDKELPNKVKNTAVKTAQLLWDKAKGVTLPTQVTNLPEEVVVEDVVNNLIEEVKKLPENQVKKAKVQFCQDVISEATESAVEN